MPKLAHRRTRTRAPRVKLGGTVLSLMRLESGRELRGRLHALSTTGGLVQVDTPLNEAIRAKARMLFPMWATHGCLQPFQFDGLREEEARKLEANLKTLLESRGT